MALAKEVLKNVVLACVIVSIISGTFIYATVHFENNYSSSTNESTLSGACLVAIPDNASVYSKVNATFAGNYEVYRNQTVAYYPYGFCPQPVPASFYAVVLTVESNSTFVKLENGSQYLYDPEASGCCGISTSNGVVVGKNAILQFDDWSHVPIRDFNNTADSPCWPYVPHILVWIPVNLTTGTYLFANMTLRHPSPISTGPRCTS